MKTYSILPEMNEHINNSIVIKEHPEYEGVVYRYGKVKVEPYGEDDERAVLDFTYEVCDNPNIVDTASEDFENFIGDILVDIISENIEESKKNGDGSDNIIESSEQ